jgi:hypothetical protein
MTSQRLGFAVKVVGAVCAVGLASAAVWLALPQKAETKREPILRNNAEVEQLSMRLAVLERQSQRTRQEIFAMQLPLPVTSARDNAEAQPEAAQTPEAELPLLDDSQAIARERAYVEKVFQRYEETFQSQPRGSRWARDMESGIRSTHALFTKELPNTRLLSAECRANFCKASLEHGDAQEQLLLPAFMRVEGLPNVSIYKETQADGSIRSRVYLSSERMPSVQQTDISEAEASR